MKISYHRSSLLLNCTIWKFLLDTDLFKLWFTSLCLDILTDGLVVGEALLAGHAAALVGHPTALVHLEPALTWWSRLTSSWRLHYARGGVEARSELSLWIWRTRDGYYCHSLSNKMNVKHEFVRNQTNQK